MESYWRMERAHRIIERHGGERQERVFVECVAGVPMIATTSFDGDRLKIVKHEFLPDSLATPLGRIASIRETWLDVLERECPRRQHNIIAALNYMEKLVAMLRERALHCMGSRYTVICVSNIIIGAVRQIANLSYRADGVFEDQVFGEAALQITSVLRAAGCAQPLAA